MATQMNSMINSSYNRRQAPNYRLEPWQRRRLAIEKAEELARKSPKYFNYKLNTFIKDSKL